MPWANNTGDNVRSSGTWPQAQKAGALSFTAWGPVGGGDWGPRGGEVGENSWVLITCVSLLVLCGSQLPR